jgi:hypothetical protein
MRLRIQCQDITMLFVVSAAVAASMAIAAPTGGGDLQGRIIDSIEGRSAAAPVALRAGRVPQGDFQERLAASVGHLYDPASVPCVNTPMQSSVGDAVAPRENLQDRLIAAIIGAT